MSGGQDYNAIVRISRGEPIMQSGGESNIRKYTFQISQRLLMSGLIVENSDGGYTVTAEGWAFIRARGDWRKMPRHERAEAKQDVRYFTIDTR